MAIPAPCGPGFKAVCVETRHAQRFLSTRPVKTNRNDARGIAETCAAQPARIETHSPSNFTAPKNLPVFRRQNFGHFVNVISTAGLQIVPTMAVYAGTKNAVRTITETLRQEAGAKLRVTGISPGFVQTNLTTSMSDPGVKAEIAERMEKMAIPPAAIARAIAFAIEQPAEVDVSEIVIRPTAQT